MKKSSHHHILINFSRWFVLLLCPIALARSTIAAQLKEASVTQIIKEVQLLPTQAAPRPAALRDHVRDGTAVRTGTDSRSELTFTDLTIARLGANTIFTFNEGTRNLNLGGGAMLLYAPKGSGGAKISTAAVTAAITGTTVIIEYHRNAYIKFISLEGIARVYLTHRIGESVLINPGQMLIVRPDAKSLPDPVHVDLKRIMQTSLLITGFPPLPSEGLIYQQVQIQTADKASGQYVDTNLVIFGGGTLVSLVDPTNINVVSQSTAAISTPPPIPSEFGSPTTISSPVPYVINSSTVITTDPTITTNGVTDFGTIYRGPAQDGPFSVFLFGSTSAFDLALKYDVEFFADPNNLPIAVFKFQSLSLIGNPIISLGNGNITKLGLIGVDGITSGPPGGTLTFSGLDELLLATQAGSINLTSDVSFQNIDTFVVYARGAGSNLTLASPILNSNVLVLAAEGSLRLALGITVSDRFAFQTGGDLISTGSGKFTVDNIGGTIDDGGRIRFKIGGDLFSQDLSLLIANNAGGHINTGGDIHLTIAGNLVANGDVTLIVGNDDGGFIGDGGNISVTTGGSLFTQGFTLIVTNYGDVFGFSGTSVGHIGTGGNIFVTTNGNLTADYIDAFIDNRNGASISSGATISFDIGGALTTHQNAPASFFSSEESLTFLISNIFRTASAGSIGSDATISLTAASVSAGGALSATISNRPAPAMIGGSAIINFDIAGNLHADDYASFAIANEDVFDVGHGGTIKGDALIDVSAANISTGQDLGFFINNRGSNSLLTPGGTIGGDATINVTAGNIVPTGPLFAEINNRAGNIGGNATINLTASGLLSLPANSLVRINSTNGGKVGKSSTINLKSTRPTGVAININSSAQLLTLLDAAAPGPGGKITILATGPSSSINVDSASGGRIHADKGTVDIQHTGDSGVINLTNSDIAADVVKVGALGTNGTLNIGGGTLSADTTLKLYAPSSNGTVNFIANVTLGGTGSTIIAGNTVTIFNGVVVTVDQPVPASVFTNHPNYAGFGGNDTTTGTFAGAGATTQPLANAPGF